MGFETQNLLADAQPMTNYQTLMFSQSTPTYWAMIKQYFPTPSSIFYTGAAFIANLATLPYVLKEHPEEISWEWWISLSPAYQAFLILNMMVFLGVGISTCLKYLPEMVNNLKDMALEYCQSIGNFACSNTALIFSATAAIPMAALGYFGQLSLGEPAAIFAGSTSFLLSIAFRLGFMTDFIGSVKNCFIPDRKLQKKLVNHLKQFNKEQLQEIESSFSEKWRNKKVDEKKIIKFLNKLVSNHPEKIPQSTCSIKKSLALSFDAALGLFFAICFLTLFGQAGFEGVKILCESLTEHCQLDTAHYIIKLGIAILTGASAGITALICGYKTRDLFEMMFEHIKKSPKQIIKVICITLCCTLTANSLANVAKSLAGENNLFKLDKDSYAYIPYLVGNFLMSCNLDGRAAAELSGIIERENADTNIIHWLEKKSLSTESITILKNNGLFNKIDGNGSQEDVEVERNTPLIDA